MDILHLGFVVPVLIFIVLCAQGAFSGPKSNLVRLKIVHGDHFIYDARGDVLERARDYVDKDGIKQVWHETYVYGVDGHLGQKVRNDGTTFQYSYGPDGQLSTQRWNDSDGSSHTIIHQYDSETGALSSLSDGTQTLSYAYFPDGGLYSTTYPDQKAQHVEQDQYGRVIDNVNVLGQKEVPQYNSFSQITEVDYHGDKLLNTYSSKDKPINHHWGQLQSFSLDRSGKTSLDVDFNFNGFNQPSATQTKEASQTTLLNTYNYDSSMRLVRQGKFSGQGSDADLNFTENNTYDSLNQLTDQETIASGNEQEQPISQSYTYDGISQSYTYDGNGNVIDAGKNGVLTPVTYNALDQRTDQKYDKNGRMTIDKPGNHYVYNELDQLVKRTGVDHYGDGVKYNYYPDGLLAQRTTADNTEQFYYRNGQVTAIKAIKGSDKPIWTDFLLVGTKRLAAYSSDDSVSPTYYLLSQKSTGVSLQDGKLEGFHYDAYGKDAPLSKPSEGAPTPKPINQQSNKSFTWDQEYRDPATGLTYLRARFYSPDLKSFMSMDSAMVDNKYNFGNGDPVGMIDPSGHMPKWLNYTLNGIGLAAGLALTYATLGAGAEAAAGEVSWFSAQAAANASKVALTSSGLASTSGATGIAAQAVSGKAGGVLNKVSFGTGIASLGLDLVAGGAILHSRKASMWDFSILVSKKNSERYTFDAFMNTTAEKLIEEGEIWQQRLEKSAGEYKNFSIPPNSNGVTTLNADDKFRFIGDNYQVHGDKGLLKEMLGKHIDNIKPYSDEELYLPNLVSLLVLSKP